MEKKIVFVDGPLIVGAGPSGLATAACLKQKGIPSLILERAKGIASLWKEKTYDRLHLHIPKHFCQLPHMPFPETYPTFPSRDQFITYLEDYVEVFELRPKFNQVVMRAEFDRNRGVWKTITAEDEEGVETEYLSKWLIVATGENAEENMPDFPGMNDFEGPIYHSSAYKNGHFFRGMKVLVVGTGNSGMEICLDLANYQAHTSLVVRDSVHIWPREVFGRSTFEISMGLLKWFPLRVVDFLLVLISLAFLGDISKLGFRRPKVGPLELKMKTGKTPVLDVGTLAKIREGKVKVVKGIKKIASHAVEFVDGTKAHFDAIILATGYKTNVPDWLKGTQFFSDKTGFPIGRSADDCWNCSEGLYAVGFSKRGLLGVSIEASKTAEHISRIAYD